MKGKKFYIILIGLIIVGIGSVFVYRQQQEARFLEFEGYEIADIERQVAGLYNEDKTDLADDISKNELEELEVTLADLQEKDLGRQNRNRIETMQEDLMTADGMLALEEDIDEIFIEESIVDKDASFSEVENFEEKIVTYEDKAIYFDRNTTRLDDAKQQVETMTHARDYIENLFTDEDEVRADVTREEEEEALELIDQVKNEEIKEELTAQIETVTLALDEREELEVLKEELAEEDSAEEDETENEDEETEEDSEEVVEEEPEYTAPPSTGNTDSSSSSNTGNPNSSSPGSSSNNTGANGGSGNTGGSSDGVSSGSEESSDNENTGDTNHVVRTYQETDTEVIPYQTVYIDDNTILQGKKYPANQDYGNGSRTVTYRVTEYQDGSTDREVIEETSELPVHQEIIRGTRESESDN